MHIAIVPRVLLDRVESDAESRIHLNVLISHLLLLLLLVLSATAFNGDLRRLFPLLPTVCVAQDVWGIPCPGCGITRSLLVLIAVSFVTTFRATEHQAELPEGGRHSGAMAG